MRKGIAGTIRCHGFEKESTARSATNEPIRQGNENQAGLRSSGAFRFQPIPAESGTVFPPASLAESVVLSHRHPNRRLPGLLLLDFFHDPRGRPCR